MTRTPTIALALFLAALAAPAARAQAQPRAPHAPETTPCAACHTVTDWREVRFDHSKTGFDLRGAHQKARCSACHGADLSRAVPKTCTACHRDEHRGEFGTRCQSCHEETSWRPLFDADAHRRTNFPLSGRHGLIPCEECHTNKRDRTFTRATVACYDCHQADYARTRGGSIDHAASGFATTCRDCHKPFRWQGASFSGHSLCFQIDGGPHGGISCFNCHTRLNLTGYTPGTCNTQTAACTRCHTCTQTDPRHPATDPKFQGYQCKDRKCFECHEFSTFPLPTPPRRFR